MTGIVTGEIRAAAHEATRLPLAQAVTTSPWDLIDMALDAAAPLIARVERERISKAMGYASYGAIDGDHHKMWVIDQMVRALTGCPVESRTATDCRGEPYTYDAQGESPEYQEFIGTDSGWDEGIAP